MPSNKAVSWLHEPNFNEIDDLLRENTSRLVVAALGWDPSQSRESGLDLLGVRVLVNPTVPDGVVVLSPGGMVVELERDDAWSRPASEDETV